MCAGIDFSHTPTGNEVIDMHLAERFSCPVCHVENYNREKLAPVYNLETVIRG
jgi:hypothetical protein